MDRAAQQVRGWRGRGLPSRHVLLARLSAQLLSGCPWLLISPPSAPRLNSHVLPLPVLSHFTHSLPRCPLLRTLLQLKTELMAELLKYKPRGYDNSLKFDRGRGSTAEARGDKVALGGVDLRYMVQQLEVLLAELKQYRPDMIGKRRARMTVKI